FAKYHRRSFRRGTLMSGFQRAQTIYDAISGRRSIRQYSSDDVSPDTIRRLISMAVMAPSAHNRQQWPFVVARGREPDAANATAYFERALAVAQRRPALLLAILALPV